MAHCGLHHSPLSTRNLVNCYMYNCSVGRSSVAHWCLYHSPLSTRDLVNCSISVLRIGHLWLTVASITLHSLLGTLLTVIPVCLTVLWIGHLWLTVVSIALQGLGSAATYLGSLLLMMKVKLSKYFFTGIVRLLLAVLRRCFCFLFTRTVIRPPFCRYRT